MIVRTRIEQPASTHGEGISAREMVQLSDGMNIRMFDVDLRATCTFNLKSLLQDASFTAAVLICTGRIQATVAGRGFELSEEELIGFSSDSDCQIDAATDARVLVVACLDASYEGILIRTLTEIENSERSIAWGNGLSQRYLVERDSLGFALCYTIGNSNTDSSLEYKNHFEACYYLSGTGEYVWADDSHPILTDGGNSTMFVMDQHDAHRMVIHDRSVCISVFCPPICGHEKHDLSGGKPSVY